MVPGKRRSKGDPIYTNLAIETVLTLWQVFHQPPSRPRFEPESLKWKGNLTGFQSAAPTLPRGTDFLGLST